MKLKLHYLFLMFSLILSTPTTSVERIDVAVQLKRVLTRGIEAYIPLHRESIFSFHNQQWLKDINTQCHKKPTRSLSDLFPELISYKLFTADEVHKIDLRYNDLLAINKDTSIKGIFYESIYERANEIIKNGYNQKKLYVGTPINSSTGKDVFERMLNSYGTTLRDCFVSGHLKRIGSSESPQAFISLYPGNVADKNQKDYSLPHQLKWFSPLEQTFQFRNLLDYRNSLATLKFWHAYSNMALVVTHPKTRYLTAYGIAYPKALNYKSRLKDLERSSYFPKILPPDISDSEIQKSAGNIKISPDKLEEIISGGGIQIYIPYIIPPPLIIDLGRLPFKDKIEFALKEGDIWGNNNCHLLNADYDLTNINLASMLKEVGILKEEEARIIEDFLKSHQTSLLT